MSAQQVLSSLILLVCFVPSAFAQDWDTPSLGFEYIGIDDFLAFVNNPRIKVPGKIGVVVVDVAPNGPSAGKLNMFDIITKIDQTQIRDVADMEAFIKTLKPGQLCSISGHGATVQNGLPKWKKDNTKLGPAKTRREVFVNALVTSVDSVTDVTEYRHTHTPESVEMESNLALLIRKDKGGEPRLLLRVSRVGDFLGIRELLFKIDGKAHRVQLLGAKMDIRDHVEWDVIDVSKQVELIKALLVTKQAVTMRHNGTQEYSDRDLSLSEIYAIRGVYQAYLAMGGKPL